MKKFKILLTLLLLLCTVTTVQAKTTKNKTDNRIEYLNLTWWQKYNDPVLTDYMSGFENCNIKR